MARGARRRHGKPGQYGCVADSEPFVHVIHGMNGLDEHHMPVQTRSRNRRRSLPPIRRQGAAWRQGYGVVGIGDIGMYAVDEGLAAGRAFVAATPWPGTGP